MKQTKYDVFISYSRKDYVDEHKNVIPGNEVSKIKGALTDAGITYWFDEKGIVPGEDYAAKILKYIKASRIFVYISSKNANESDWTREEIACALMYKKYVIPVLLDDSPFHDSVMLRIVDLDRIDYYLNSQNGLEKLTRSINTYLSEIKEAEARQAEAEKRRQEELERQRKQQEEEKRRQEKIAKIESEIAALESQMLDRKKIVLQKEQELKLAQIDLEDCESKIKKLQLKLDELRNPDKERKAKEAEEKRKAEEQRLAEERKREAERKAEEERKRREEEERAKEKTITVGGVSFKMIRVEGGSFMMGSPDNDSDAYSDEKPQHRVTLSDYYIGETVVTQEIWKAVMGNNPSNWKGDKLPVESVSWYDCQKFIKQLNAKTGKTFRLPTEAEWEYAARGGKKSQGKKSQGYKYSGNNNIDDVAWYTDNSDSETHPVKGKKANKLGLYDMSGNVWEWCQDWYGSYSGSTQTNPSGPSSGSGRVLRGGSWDSRARLCRVAYRGDDSPGARGSYGFRLALVHQ